MKKIPFLLIYSRILIGFLIVLIAFFHPLHHKTWIVSLMSIGLLTDVFDGIIARKLNVSSEKLRIWDSNVDQFFWLATIGAIFYLNFNFVQQHLIWILILLFLEGVCYLTSYVKFRKSIATHSILAKIWTLSLLAFLIDLTLNETSTTIFALCIFLGILSRIEINKGIPIKKSKLFNS